MRKILAGFAALALIAITAGFAVNVNGALVNAMTGFQFNGAAPNGHVLCGNGTVYVDATGCGTGLASFQGRATPAAVLTTADVNGVGTITNSTSGNAATATLASNSSAVGGVALGGLCQTGGSGCPSARGGTLTDVTGSRSFGGTFANANPTPMYVSGFGTTAVGGDTSNVICQVNSIQVWAAQYNATVAGAHDGFSMMVPAGASYRCDVTGTSTPTLTSWTEFVF